MTGYKLSIFLLFYSTGKGYKYMSAIQPLIRSITPRLPVTFHILNLCFGPVHGFLHVAEHVVSAN